MVRRNDMFGRSFGVDMRTFSGTRTPAFKRPPKPVYADGAHFKTVQAIDSFAIGTGVSASSSTNPSYILATASANKYFAIAFELQDCDNVTTFSELFDQYRIDMVEFRMIPTSTVIDQHDATGANTVNPMVWVVADFDDSTVLSGIAAAQEYANVQVFEGGQGISLDILPSITPSVFASGAFSGYKVSAADWIDMANVQVPHYGVKGVVQALSVGSTQAISWTVSAKYHLSFRNIR